MAALPILCYPDPRLHTVAKPVVAVNDAVRQLVADMAQTMYEAPGIGLAATQVNVHQQVIVIDLSFSEMLIGFFVGNCFEGSWSGTCEQMAGFRSSDKTARCSRSACLQKFT